MKQHTPTPKRAAHTTVATKGSVPQTDGARKNNFTKKSKPLSFSVFGGKPRWLAVNIFLFLLLATCVFFVSDHFAEKTATGFPNFQDYQIDLVDQTNTPQTVKNFVDQPVALFFGFTYCPDVCPTTLSTLAAARDELLKAGVNTDPLRIVFVTVDPLRDTPEQMSQYLSLFDADVTGLTGTLDNVSALLKQFGIYTKKIDEGDGDYLFDHSAAVFLYRADGRFKGTIIHNEPFTFVTEKLKSVL